MRNTIIDKPVQCYNSVFRKINISVFTRLTVNVFQHEQTMNSSFDDLPPPPPPISSSPAPPDDDVEEVRFRQKLEKKGQKFPLILKTFSISRSLRVITAALWPPHRSRCRSREAVFGGTNTSTFQSLNGSVSVLEVLEVF